MRSFTLLFVALFVAGLAIEPACFWQPIPAL